MCYNRCMKKLSVFLYILFLFGCASVSSNKTVTLFCMNTSVVLTCYGKEADKCLSDCSVRLREIEVDLDIHNPDGSIYALNHSSGDWTQLGADAFFALSIALEYASLTDGAFDPSVGSILAAWDDFSGKVVPSEQECKDAANLCDYRLIQLDEAAKSAKVGQNQTVALGGIGKGYAANELKKIFIAHGCSGIINLGGNVYAVGSKGNVPFNVGIRSPFDPNSLVATIPLTDCSLVTSGAYERNFTVDNVFYHHIFNPRTGTCADSDLASVSIIDSDSARADALSTAVFVMGYEKGLAFLTELEQRAILVRSDGTVTEVEP